MQEQVSTTKFELGRTKALSTQMEDGMSGNIHNDGGGSETSVEVEPNMTHQSGDRSQNGYPHHHPPPLVGL